MKKLMTVITLAAVLAASTTAMARDHKRDHRGPSRDGNVAMEMVGHAHRVLKELDLSEAQQEAIKAEFKTMKESLKPLLEAQADNRAALHELLTADNYDAAAVSAVADEQGEISADMVRLASKTIHAAMSELTGEQREQLAEMREKRHDRMEQRLGQLQKKLERMDENG